MSFRFSIATGATIGATGTIIGATFVHITIISRQAGATGVRLVDGTAITRGLAIGAHGDAFWSGRCGFARNSKARLAPGFFFSAACGCMAFAMSGLLALAKRKLRR